MRTVDLQPRSSARPKSNSSDDFVQVSREKIVRLTREVSNRRKDLLKKSDSVKAKDCSCVEFEKDDYARTLENVIQDIGTISLDLVNFVSEKLVSMDSFYKNETAKLEKQNNVTVERLTNKVEALNKTLTQVKADLLSSMNSTAEKNSAQVDEGLKGLSALMISLHNSSKVERDHGFESMRNWGAKNKESFSAVFENLSELKELSYDNNVLAQNLTVQLKKCFQDTLGEPIFKKLFGEAKNALFNKIFGHSNFSFDESGEKYWFMGYGAAAAHVLSFLNERFGSRFATKWHLKQSAMLKVYLLSSSLMTFCIDSIVFKV